MNPPNSASATPRVPHYVDPAPFDPEAGERLSAGLERYYMASQWRMVWRNWA